MLPTTGSERARYEQLLARAHQAVWQLHLMLNANDEYEMADDMFSVCQDLGELMETSLRKGGRLRTVPRPRA